jgi:hypothetical protein
MGADEYCGGLDRPFVRGDSNGDGRVDISDPVHTLNFLFLGGQVLRCRRSGDGDDNGKLEITDPIYVLNHLFLGGPAPPSPYPACGLDETPDALTCVHYDPCA